MQSQPSDRIQRTSHRAPLAQPAPPPLPSSVAPNPTPHPAATATSLLVSHLPPLSIHPHSHLSCPHQSALLHHRPCRSPASASCCARRVSGRRRQRRRRQSPCRAAAGGSLTPSSSAGLLTKPLASGALASQLRPALLVNQRYRHGPSLPTLLPIPPPLSPLSLISWHWPRMARYLFECLGLARRTRRSTMSGTP
jgi:hypothetical protein